MRIGNFDSLLHEENLNENTEIIPLTNPDEEHETQEEPLPEIIPILPVKNTVLFPGVITPISIRRESAMQLFMRLKMRIS